MANHTQTPFSSGKLRRVIRFCRQRPLGAIGGLIFLIMVFTALTADWIAPYNPLINDYKAMLSPPSINHFMGTDAHGRDVLSRIIYGSRTALLVGFSSSFCGTMLGAIIGVICAYFGGKTDVIVQRFMEILLSFPLIVMALAMMAVLGTGILNVIVAITIPMVPRSAQVIRSCALSIRNMPYVDAARACGFGHIRIMFRHILPNVAAPFLILVTASWGERFLRRRPSVSWGWEWLNLRRPGALC